jgi:hypothetical protein
MTTPEGALLELAPTEAAQAVQQLMNGEPPPVQIIDMMSVGLEEDLAVFDEEYFDPRRFVVDDATRGSTFKMVEAYYGGGKTHYLRAVERLALRRGFASAFVGLRKDECPLTRFDLVHRAVCDSLAVVKDDRQVIRGLGNVMRHVVATLPTGEEGDLVRPAQQSADGMPDMPLASFKIALREAMLAIASGGHAELDGLLVYLQGGRISPSLRKHGILEPIDQKSGTLALRSLAVWLRHVGYNGFLLMLDEGDRSLSIGQAKDRQMASNNLVQLINETAMSEHWPSTIFIYSIPNWHDFEKAFGHNNALIQRVEKTGFPLVPPAPRIVLDDRYEADSARLGFCEALAGRLTTLFKAARADRPPERQLTDDSLKDVVPIVAAAVLDADHSASFRRLFVQTFLQALYYLERGKTISREVADDLARQGMQTLRQEG